MLHKKSREQETNRLLPVILLFSRDKLVKLPRRGAGWSSLAARRAHNPKVVGSNPTPATKCCYPGPRSSGVCFWCFGCRSAVGETDRVGKYEMDNSVIRQLLEPVVEDMGYELVMVETTGSPSGGQVLRAYIDAPGGILLEDCEQVSRQVSAILDVEDPIRAEYTLEVSSPGIDRPLVKPEHFQRFQGNQVRVVMREARLGRRRFTGFLVEAGAECVVVEVDGEPYELDYQAMEKANLVGLE